MTPYKPHAKAGGSYGPEGIAKIIYHPTNGKAKVILRVTDKDGNVQQSEYILDQENLPKSAKAGIWHVQMSSKCDKVYRICPENGVFEGKFSRFPAKEGQVPQPSVNKKFGYLVMRPMFVLTSPEVVGMEVGYQWGLHYIFDEEIDDDGASVVQYSVNRGKSLEQTDEFLNATGVWDKGRMPYKPNVLPFIQKRALDASKTVKIVIEGGYIKSLINSPTSEDFE